MKTLKNVQFADCDIKLNLSALKGLLKMMDIDFHKSQIFHDGICIHRSELTDCIDILFLVTKSNSDDWSFAYGYDDVMYYIKKIGLNGIGELVTSLKWAYENAAYNEYIHISN